MPSLIALYDSCVLYPAPVRDLFLELALTELFHAKWSADIHAEWIGSVLRDRPDLRLEQLDRTRKLMDMAIGDAIVTGYEILIDGLTLPDSNDRHVLAAAIAAHADVIVTFNLRDFPTELLAPYGIESQHPDHFATRLFDISPVNVCDAANSVRMRLQNPPKSAEEYLATLDRCGLPRLVSQLRQHCNTL